jgi:hypothetical protein
VEPTRPTLRERKVERMQVCEKEYVSSLIPGNETFGHALERTSVSGEPDDAVLSGRGDWFARGRSRLHPRNGKKSGDLKGRVERRGWSGMGT